MNIKNCIVKTTAIAFILILSIAQGFCAEFYVFPKGKDENPGTKKKPFATLSRARNAVRKRLAEGLKENVSVLIRSGTYELSETLVFGPEDSGTKKYSVTYAAFPGESVVVSGGRRIVGWKKGDGNLWTARVPGVKKEKWYPRQLFVNGRRATRARMPDLDASTPMVQIESANLSKDLKVFTVKFPAGIVKDWRNPGDIELIMQGNWAINRKRVERLDEKSGVLTLAPSHVLPLEWNAPRRGRWCFFENAREFLDAPGEWYLDHQTGIVSYWPRQNEDMTKAKAVVPRLTRLLEVVGTPERPVRNLHFKGIRFEHADWDLPAGGYMGVQACHFYTSKHGKTAWERIGAAIQWDYVESSSVTDGAIAHMGGVGIALIKGCHRNVIEGNRIFDISANGIMLGGPTDEPNVPKDNRIANNHIYACGIWVGLAQRTRISHNLIHDLPLIGISVGWQWNPELSPCKENTIEYNHIYDVMKRLGDGGGIYTLGFQPGTVIRGNHIHDIRRSPYAQAAPNNGMFLDEGSKGFIFERNVIYNTAGQPVRHNQNSPEWHTWKDNHFGTTPHTPGKIGTAVHKVVKKAGLELGYRNKMGQEKQETRRNAEQADER